VIIYLAGAFAFILLVLATLYNSFVRLRNELDAAAAQVEVQLNRRLDLIPNLVEGVKGYAAHEKETLERTIRARDAVRSSAVPGSAAGAELNASLRGLLALAERYPDLKADEHFRALQEELTTTENRIAFARQYFNDMAARYNVAIETLPGVLVAGAFGFYRRDFFESPDGAESAPSVAFS
jgi:LemA protein